MKFKSEAESESDERRHILKIENVDTKPNILTKSEIIDEKPSWTTKIESKPKIISVEDTSSMSNATRESTSEGSTENANVVPNETTQSSATDSEDIHHHDALPSHIVEEDSVEHITPSTELTSLSHIHSRTAKRRRILMEAVELPTLALISKKRRSALPLHTPALISIDTSSAVNLQPNYDHPKAKLETPTRGDKIKLEKLQNPKIKIDKEAGISDESLIHRLNAIGFERYPIPLPDDIKEAAVTRRFMSDTYGGSTQCMNPTIDRTRFTHGLDDFHYLTYQYNPDCPKYPGDPGLMYRCRGGPAGPWPKIMRLIMRTAAPWWTYMGQYQLTPSHSLTKKEWILQTNAFQNHWAAKVSKKIWGKPVRTRIGLRLRLGREPTHAELAQEPPQDMNVTVEQIKNALALGQEEISVWCMKCVGYDERFQRALASMPKNWKPKSPVNKKKENLGRDRKEKSASANTKRETGDDKVDVEMAAGEHAGTMLRKKVYVPRGTRSRPLVL